MKAVADIIMVTADEPYFGPWHTQLIYTEYLASQGEVFFLNPPTPWTLSKLFTLAPKETRIHDRLTVIYYNNIFPSFLNTFNEWYNQLLIKRRLKKKNVKSVLIWHFDSFRNCFNTRSFVKAFSIKRIYHVIDPFMNNPWNKLLSELSDLLVITSPRHNTYYSEYQHKLINIPQVIDLELNKTYVRGTIKAELELKEKFVVLLGTLSDDVDYSWLLSIAESPDINLVLIGKNVAVKAKPEFEALLKKKNVQYLGLMSPAEFYPVIARAKAGLVIHNPQKRKQISSSLKSINYLVAGIPIITNIDTETNILQDKGIYITDTIPEFETAVKAACNTGLPFDVSAANAYLQSISLEKAVDTILSKI